MKKTNRCLANAGTIKYMLVLTTLSLTFLFTACNNGEKKKTEPTTLSQAAPSGAAEFQMNCVMLSRAQVQAWVDSGWTKPGSSDEIKNIMLQFFSPDVAKSNSNMSLIGYPALAPDNVKQGGKVELQVDNTCTVQSFSGPVIFGNNEVLISNLDILNPDGTLKDFEFIRFTPQQTTKFGQYMTFKVETVNKGTAKLSGGDGGTFPCPPMCCPPSCPD